MFAATPSFALKHRFLIRYAHAGSSRHVVDATFSATVLLQESAWVYD
jgi:hypothetical protein